MKISLNWLYSNHSAEGTIFENRQDTFSLALSVMLRKYTHTQHTEHTHTHTVFEREIERESGQAEATTSISNWPEHSQSLSCCLMSLNVISKWEYSLGTVCRKLNGFIYRQSIEHTRWVSPFFVSNTHCRPVRTVYVLCIRRADVAWWRRSWCARDDKRKTLRF